MNEQDNFSLVTVKITESQLTALQRMGVETVSGSLSDLIEVLKGQMRVMRDIASGIDLCVQMMAQDREGNDDGDEPPSFLNTR